MPIDLWRKLKANAAMKGLLTHQYVIDLLKRAVKEEDNN